MSKNNKDIYAMLKGTLSPMVTTLNGLMDKVPTAMKAEIQTLRDQFNTQLETLGPLDQVPAATEINWGMERLCYAVDHLQTTLNALAEKSAKLAGIANDSQTQLAGFNEKITKGELLDKAGVQALVDAAKEAARKEMLPEIAATRKLALNGLVEPADEILQLPSKDFNARLEQANKNVAAMTAAGLKNEGSGAAWFKRCTWQSTEEFAGSQELLKSIKAPTQGEPLLGGGEGGGEAKVQAPAGKLFL